MVLLGLRVVGLKFLCDGFGARLHSGLKGIRTRDWVSSLQENETQPEWHIRMEIVHPVRNIKPSV